MAPRGLRILPSTRCATLPQATQTLAASRCSPRAARARPYALASSRPARYNRLTRRPCLAPAETAGPLPAGGWCAAAAPRTSGGCRSLRVPERATAERATAERATAERSPDGRTDRPRCAKDGVCVSWRARRAWARPSEVACACTRTRARGNRARTCCRRAPHLGRSARVRRPLSRPNTHQHLCVCVVCVCSCVCGACFSVCLASVCDSSRSTRG